MFVTKGTKIQLVKPMGLLTKVGEIFEVYDLKDNGVISFRFGTNGQHLAMMSFDELGRYFKVLEEEKKTPKRKWSKWEEDEFVYFGLDGNDNDVPVKYRTNGKVVELRTNYKDKENLRVKASCNKCDKFDFESGLNLADARMSVKFMQKELDKLLESM